MDSGLTDTEFLGDLMLGSPTADGGDDGSSSSGVPITLPMATSWEGCGFSVQITTG